MIDVSHPFLVYKVFEPRAIKISETSPNVSRNALYSFAGLAFFDHQSVVDLSSED